MELPAERTKVPPGWEKVCSTKKVRLRGRGRGVCGGGGAEGGLLGVLFVTVGKHPTA